MLFVEYYYIIIIQILVDIILYINLTFPKNLTNSEEIFHVNQFDNNNKIKL